MTFFLLSLALCQDVQSKQATERKKPLAEKETSLHQKYNEELKKMIKQCKQMNIQVQDLKKNESKNP